MQADKLRALRELLAELRGAATDTHELGLNVGDTLAQWADRLAAIAEAAEDLRADAMRWAPVAGYEGAYEVNPVGQVRSLDRIDTDGNRRKGGHLAPYRKSKGYFAVALCAAGDSEERYVHRLVASAFIPNPDGLPQVNHKDGDPANNWVANLEWVTNAENQLHACRVLSRNVRAVYGVSRTDGTRVDFPSLQHAVEAGFIRANIQKCIAGDRGSHRGYRWFDAALSTVAPVREGK